MMHWEPWSIPTANMITDRATEAEALGVVRELLATGWTADEPSLIAEDETLPVEALPPALSGDELVRRAERASSGSQRSARRRRWTC